MTLQSELTEARATAATGTPQGGSYVSLPAGSEVPPRPEGSYVSLPGAVTESASKAQGTYVTLSTAPAGKAEVSYTRVG